MPNNKVVLITGGSRGIGAQTAKLFAEHGYAVCINYRQDVNAARDVEQYIHDLGGNCILVQGDIAKEEDVVRIFRETKQKLGSISVMVNNAAILHQQGKITELTAARIENTFSVNVTGSFLCCIEAVKHMAYSYQGDGGVIINVSSMAALSGSANEMAHEGIRVNGVRPGLFYTQMHKDGGEANRVDRLKSKIPLGRGGQPQEVAQAIQWQVKEQLASTDEHVFDYYDHPAAIGGKEKVNVVAISRPQVTSIIKGISQADLKLSTITIEELATSELLAASDDAVLSLFQEKGGQINLNILKQGKLFFSRRLKGYENLASFSLEEFQMGMGDTLSVEIQRSMDYFESQLRQAPVRHIVVHLNTPIQAQLAELIKELTFMPVSIMDLPLTPNEPSPTVSLASLGAALTDIEINSEAGQ